MNYKVIDLIKKYYLGIFIPISLLFLYPFIRHGDHEFYELIYNNNELIIDNPFFMNDMLTGWVTEFFFGTILIFLPKFITYDLFNFLLDVILFSSLTILLKKYLKKDIFVLLVTISCNYFFVFALASARSEIVLIFFILTMLHKDNNYLFYTFYFLSFLTHVGLSVLFYLSFFIIFFKDIKFLKKNTIFKIILILLPLFHSSPLLLAKAVGYNFDNNQNNVLKPMNYQHTSIEELVKKKEDLEKELLLEIKQKEKHEKNSPKEIRAENRIQLYLLEYNQLLNKINLYKSNLTKNFENEKKKKLDPYDKSNIFEKIRNELSYNFSFNLINLKFSDDSLIVKKSLLLKEVLLVFNMTLYTFIILASFHVFLYLIKKDFLFTFLHFITFIFVYGLTGFTKGTLLLFLITFFLILNNYNYIIAKKINLLLIFSFFSLFLYKNILMINKLILYGRLF